MSKRKILHFASLAILALGLGAASCIYVLVDDPGDGNVYSVPTHATKLYAREIQRFGGTAALLFDDLSRWFSGLWHGRALAGTLLGISVLASLALFFVARIFFPEEPHG
jgi:hypothetical protein